MELSDVDPLLIRRSMRLALDLLKAHRIAKGLSLDVGGVTAARESLEERLEAAFHKIDPNAMPSTWSSQKAAEILSVQAALQIIREQKSDLPDHTLRNE